MRNAFFLVLVLTNSALAIGCTESAANHKEAVGNSLDRPFAALTYASGRGGMTFESIADECSDSTLISVDSEGYFSLDACVSNEQGLREAVSAQQRLTAAQMALVQDALGKVVVGSSGNCGADKGVETLTLESSDGTVARYIDDFYSCSPAPEGETYVQNIGAVSDALYLMKPSLTLRTLPFDTLKLTLSGGMPRPDSTACADSYLDQITLDVNTSTLTWDYCDTAVVQGSRVLSTTELVGVASALARTSRTYYGSCVDDVPVASIAFTRGSEVTTYVDSTMGYCSANPMARYAESLGDLKTFLHGLRASAS